MTNQHPITPPPELVEQWVQDHSTKYNLARRAAQWGADMELEACCEWLDYELVKEGSDFLSGRIAALRAARRPKPPSLAKEALEAWERKMASHEETDADMNTIHRALERLQKKDTISSWFKPLENNQ